MENNAVGAKDAKLNAFGLGYQFDFSKRTALYTSATRFQNTGDGLGRFNSSIAGLTTTTDKSLTEIAVGVRHAF